MNKPINVGLIGRGVPAYRANGDLLRLRPGVALVAFAWENTLIEAEFSLATGHCPNLGWSLTEESRQNLLALAPGAPKPEPPPPPEPKKWKKVSPGRRKR